jgi:antitoxin VapB
MPISVRDPRAAELARELAARRGGTMTEAIIAALQAELKRTRPRESLASVAQRISADLRRHAEHGGRDMTKDEIDAMWGH